MKMNVNVDPSFAPLSVWPLKGLLVITAVVTCSEKECRRQEVYNTMPQPEREGWYFHGERGWLCPDHFPRFV